MRISCVPVSDNATVLCPIVSDVTTPEVLSVKAPVPAKDPKFART